MNISLDLAIVMSDSDKLREFAMWLWMKHKFVNGRYYEDSYTYIAKESGLSRNSVKKYINFFIAEGWCEQGNGWIGFIGLQALKNKYNIKDRRLINIARNAENLDANSAKNIVTLLRYEILKNKHDRFEVLKEMSMNLHNPTGPNALRKHKKAIAFFKKRPGLEPIRDVTEHMKYSSSVYRIGQLVNRSTSTASRLTSALKSARLISIKYNYTITKLQRGFNFSNLFPKSITIEKESNKQPNQTLFINMLFTFKPNSYYNFL